MTPFRHKLLYGIGALALILVLAGAWVAWRYTAPVRVELKANVNDLPFQVEITPPVVDARPGEMVSVIYRIRNTNYTPLEAFGKVQVEPSSARDQIKIFLTQCGGLNTFQNGLPADYLVYFRVQPAGLFGASDLVIDHIFTRAYPAPALAK